MEFEEVELVKRAQAGDSRAFAVLVSRHQAFVYNLALRSVCDPQEAEDIAQEAFLRAWLALPGFRREAQFRTWLYRIVVNLCYNRLPRLKKELEAGNIGETTWLPGEGIEERHDMADQRIADPLEVLEAEELRAILHREVERLPEGYQMMIMLRYQQGLSYRHVAEVMDLPLGTVKTGLYRAHARLRQALRRYEEVLV